MNQHKSFQNSVGGVIPILCSSVLAIFLCIFVPKALFATEVPVYPGQDLESMVSSYPAGTTFLIEPGIHRMQSVVPKNYDSFIGQPNAIMDGAEQLLSFQQSGSYWVAHVDIPVKIENPSICDRAHPACDFPEDLFFGDVPRTRVPSLSQVTPRRWYLDYNTGNAYMGDNPAGHNVEISVCPYAFSGAATGVTIAHLIIEKYASPHSSGAINGQMGMGGSGANVVVQYNEIYYNNYAGYSYGWEAGGTKFVYCSKLKIQYNKVFHNRGPGIWLDVNNNGVLVESNQTEHNILAGIFVEISYHVTVRYNYIAYDGYNPQGSSIWWGAGILNNSSSSVVVYGNTVNDCMNGIAAIQADRGLGPYGPHFVQYFEVHNNTIDQGIGTAEGIVKATDYDNSVYTSWHNYFQNDTYSLSYPLRNYFYWLGAYRTLSWWDEYLYLH